MLKRRYTYGVHENCLIFNTHHPQSIYVQNISALLTLDVQFLNKPSYPLEQTMEQKPHRASNEIKTKTNPSHVTFKLTTHFDLPQKQRHGIIEG